ncbi:hypothetical protein RM61_07180 [Xanthomonas phaseoli pv. phaseoli]|uniref:hypothetical protein n=1 Tax=Xanthomonas phaseoli TaxID=1985254 RepID=UPI000575A675|nr:hypothetical protein [Xanthomonas phaseoli]KHS08001.1 hypothetical protein RM61_07180 [Xanthomonas phaseoli pv. phaseoli]
MTQKKTTPGKRGRKASPPGAKLSQLTIRLPPTQRLGLAMLARERGISISQAVELAVGQVLSEYGFEGTNVLDFVYRWGPREKLSKPNGRVEAEALAEEALNSETLFILLLPDRLRTPEETFFVQAVRQLGLQDAQGKVAFAVNGEVAEQLLLACKAAFRRGEEVSEIVEEWNDALRKGE